MEQIDIQENKEVGQVIENIEDSAKKAGRKILMLSLGLALILGGAIFGTAYLLVASNQVYIEKAQIIAPEIGLSPENSGILEELFVREGDTIEKDTVVARVGNEIIKSKTSGLVISAKENIGKIFNRGEAVVVLIDKNNLRVVGRVEEDKGFKDISLGNRASFSVDAFSGKKYFGVVDEISPTSRQSDVVFNVSNKREIKEFDIKVRFDTELYIELKNGMSAKVWVYKK